MILSNDIQSDGTKGSPESGVGVLFENYSLKWCSFFWLGNCSKFNSNFEFEYQMWVQIYQKFEKDCSPFIKLAESEYW